MNSNIETTSYQIGEAFENYVQNTIFPKDNYVLIHRTNSYEQNSVRYSEESKRPDFKFRCKSSKQEFYVEAKFRSKFNRNEKLHIIEIGQYNRYKEIEKIECPVLIIIGYEGTASNPKALSLIRIDKIEYLDLYKSVLKKHEIEKKACDNGFLNDLISKVDEQTKPAINDETPKIKRTNVFLAIAVILVGLLIFVFFTSNKDEKTPTTIDGKDKTKLAQTHKNKIQREMHSSVNNWNDNIIVCNSKSLIIRIDETDKGLRYVSWNHGRKISEKPSLILYNGVDESGEFLEGEKWTFKNESWIYEIDKVNICDEPKGCGVFLKLYQNKELKQTTKLRETK